MKTLLALPLTAILLSGCVVLPLGPRHAYVEGGPAVVGPPAVVVRPYYRPYYGSYYRPHYRRYWHGD